VGKATALRMDIFLILSSGAGIKSLYSLLKKFYIFVEKFGKRFA
jgi:hypothetical protein